MVNVAVVGATGSVGREMLNVLSQRDNDGMIGEVYAVASSRSEGKKVSFGYEKELTVLDLEKFDFSNVDVALFSPGQDVSKVFAPRAADAGCIVIDNTSYFRMHDDVPLIVPEVNGSFLSKFGTGKGIISNPNCSTIQMLLVLKPLHDVVPIKRVIVSTYQSVSGAGQNGMDELWNQTKACFEGEECQEGHFTKQMAFNCYTTYRYIHGGWRYKRRMENESRDKENFVQRY